MLSYEEWWEQAQEENSDYLLAKWYEKPKIVWDAAISNNKTASQIGEADEICECDDYTAFEIEWDVKGFGMRFCPFCGGKLEN